MHGEAFVKELMLRSKIQDREIAITYFLTQFWELATKNKGLPANSRLYPASQYILLKFPGIANNQVKAIEEFRQAHLTAEECHAEEGAVHPAQGDYAAAEGADMFWMITPEAAINKLLALIGLNAVVSQAHTETKLQEAPQPKNSRWAALFSVEVDSSQVDEEEPEDYPECRFIYVRR